MARGIPDRLLIWLLSSAALCLASPESLDTPALNCVSAEDGCARGGSLLMVEKSIRKTQLGQHEGPDASERDPVRHANALVQPDEAPQELVQKVGGGSQEVVGLQNFHLVMSYVAPSTTARILEVGAGFGRHARYFASYLDAQRGGEFHGFDVDPELIQWGQAHLTPKYPLVKLQVADVSSDYYPSGSQSAEEYTFPYESDYFDVVMAPSVWTHLRTAAAVRYLKETFRVLKPGGQAYLNFLLVDGASLKKINDRAANSDLPLVADLVNYEPGVRWGAQSKPDEFEEAFSEEWVKSQVLAIGFHLVSIHKGEWAGPERATGLKAGQDHVLLMKPPAVA